jgi:hypothetical protein
MSKRILTALALTLATAAWAGEPAKSAPKAEEPGPAATSPALAKAKVAAQRMGKALLEADLETFAALTWPKAIELNGGKEKMLATVRDETAKMKEEGISFRDVRMGEPHSLMQGKSSWYLIVPQTIELKVPAGKVTQESFLVGISADKSSWTFLDGGALDEPTLRQLIPDLPKAFSLPAKKEPVATPD